MKMDNLFNDGKAVCIGTDEFKPKYTRGLNFDCKQKVIEIRNGLHKFNNTEKIEIIKSVLLQLEE